MSLAYTILRYCDAALKDPTVGGDRNWLAKLSREAKEAFEGIVALHAPASPMTWETTLVMRGATQVTNRNPFTFPRPVEIVGFYPTIVVLTTGGGAITPSADVISCQIDTDNENYMTSGDGVSTNAGGTAGPFVTLQALSVQVPRVVGYKLRNPKPSIGFTYRWKQDVTAGAVYKDCLVSMAMYARYL